MTTTRETILGALATTLAGITTGGGYNTTVTTVERPPREISSVIMSERPYIGIHVPPQTEGPQYLPGQRLRSHLRVELYCYLEATSDSNREAIVFGLHRDLHVALNTDQGVGGVACGVTLGAEEHNVSERGSREAWLIVPVTVRFHEAAV